MQQAMHAMQAPSEGPDQAFQSANISGRQAQAQAAPCIGYL